MGREVSESLARLAQGLQDGALDYESYREKCLGGLASMGPFFDDLESRLGPPPGLSPVLARAWEARQEKRAEDLGRVRALLRAGVRSFLAWADEGDPADHEEGLLLVRHGEDVLDQLHEDLQRDADLPLSRLELGGDLLGTLAEGLRAGTLPVAEYQAMLEDFVRETSRYVAEGQSAFEGALTFLRMFRGDNPEVLGAAADLLRRASQEWLAAATNAREQPV